MTTKQYVEKYKLNKLNSRIPFEKFLQDLIAEFDEKIEITIQSRKKVGLDFTYNIFRELVKEMQTKFWAISNKTMGVLPEKIWNAFYASGVVTRRAKFFPKEHKEISLRRQRYIKDKDGIQA